MKKILISAIICFVFNISYSQKSVAIYWDASYSMNDRKLERELTFLDNYFKKNSEANVILTMFSNDILLKQSFKIDNGNWANLKVELEKTIYDGSTAYSVLFKDNVDEYLIFTDGIENIETFKPPTDKPIYIIASLEDINTPNLKLQAALSSGRLIHLNTDLNTNESTKEEKVSSLNEYYITGETSSFEGKLPNVSIINQTTGKGVASDARGNYRIEAKKGDVIVYTFLGKKTVSIRVDKANVVNITMVDAKDSLDEVVINAEVEREELVNTGFGVADKKRLGYDVQTITSEEISELDTDLTGAVKGQFANLAVPNQAFSNTFDISQFIGRGRNMTVLGNQYGLIVVDGVPLAGSDSGTFVLNGGDDSPANRFKTRANNMINPDMIHSITYLKGLAATNRFGTIGRNGVILITTKNAALGNASNKNSDKPIGTTATYSGNAEAISKLANVNYIKDIQKSTTIGEAINKYLELQNKHGDNPIFYLDMYDYFLGWNNPVISDRLISNIYEIAFDDAKILKAMAYKQQANRDFAGAVKTYEQILNLEPNQSQAYRNLALAYAYSGAYQKALKIYDNLDKNLGVNNIVKRGLYKTLNIETKNLVALHKGKINTTSINEKFKKPIQYESRIVVEWNDLDAEFDLSIINPQNRVWTWSHTQAEESNRILQEKQEGFALEENQLYATDKGKWTFNIKYYGKTSKDKSPTFLKITTYKDYGKPNQSKKIEVFRLDKKNVEQTATKVVIR